MEREKEREKVLVPVRRHKTIQKEELPKELPEEPGEVKVQEIPRRWHVY